MDLPWEVTLPARPMDLPWVVHPSDTEDLPSAMDLPSVTDLPSATDTVLPWEALSVVVLLRDTEADTVGPAAMAGK